MEDHSNRDEIEDYVPEDSKDQILVEYGRTHYTKMYDNADAVQDKLSWLCLFI